MKSTVLLLCLTTLFVVQPSHCLNVLQVLYKWNFIDYVFPSVASRQAMIHQGLYIPNNSVPLDVDTYKGRIFVTTPRFKKGIPATLSTISKQGNVQSPLLDPYPDWSWHKPGHCMGLTSVFRIKIDECGRMWVLDTGSVDTISYKIKHLCPKQLVVFDLASDKLIRRHRFPQSVIQPDTILNTVEVDVRDRSQKCRSTFAYIADSDAFGLIVYDAKNDRSWRITANSFWPIPYFGYFSLQGSSYDSMKGILGLALSPYIENHDRTLYYHGLSTNTENHVLTSLLQNETHYFNGGNKVMRQFNTFANQRLGQSAGMAMSSNGVLFYSDLTTASVYCWKSTGATPYMGAGDHVVDSDVDPLQFVTSIKTKINDQGVEEVWVVSSRLQKYFVDTMNTLTETNFWVMKATVASLVGTSNCA